ncbi:MAG: hypothetical protein VB142_03305 [Burkholderia sp.]
MPGHLPSLIIGHGKTALGVDAVQDHAARSNGGVGSGIFHFAQGDEQRGALDQRRDRRRIMRVLDQVAFPVPRHDPLVDLGRTTVDTDPVRDAAPAVFTLRPGPPTLAGLSQTEAISFRSRLAARQGVQRSVDRFVTGQQGRLIGVHVSQYAHDLSGKVPLTQQPLDRRPQRPLRIQSGGIVAPRDLSGNWRAAGPAAHDSRQRAMGGLVPSLRLIKLGA